MEDLGIRLSFFNGIGSMGLLIGNLITEVIMAKSWFGIQVFGGSTRIASLLLLVYINSFYKITARGQN